MGNVKLFTQYRRPPKHLEENDGLTITESAGYIPPKVQIENLINAGKRLAQWRKEQYDFPEDDDVDESFEDPTRGPGYDLADASRDAKAVSDRIRAKAAAGKAEVDKVKAEAKKIYPEGSAEPEKGKKT